MGLIHIELFATLDLVGQAPGGPDEDPVGFPFGGWQAPLLDEVAGAARTTRSPRSSTAFRSTWLPAAGPTSRGPCPRSSARIWPARYARSVTGTIT
jgi:uracil-DNA glycosylase